MEQKPWRKVLYERQGYPDNFVDRGQFLNGLKKNLYTRTYAFTEVLVATGVVTQELSCVCLFVSVYWYVQEGWVSPFSLLLGGVAAIGGCGLLFVLFQSPHKLLNGFVISDYMSSSVIFVCFLCGVSPILKTLTESISTDTIWAMTVGMLLIHLLFYNYGSEGEKISNAISLNAAIFASVCLASRLPQTLHVFVIMTFAVAMFALFPHLRAEANALNRPVTQPLVTFSLVSCAAPLMGTISLTGLAFYLISVAFITLLCPVWLVRLQSLKNNIYGPWDEATISTDP